MKLISPEEAGFSSDRLKRIDTRMQWYIDEGIMAGAVTLVARRGRVVHFNKHGWQDIESKMPMTLDTIFRIFSMTKPIASVALMMLYEQGLFQLSDPVTKFLPEFKKVKVYVGDGKLEDPVREITIHQLLTHTAGLAYGGMPSPVDEMYDNADLWNIDITLEECIHKIAALPLMYQPGERWYYSAATDVVARLVEMIGDTNMAEFLREKILNPLGMVDTDYTVPPEKVDRIANLYGLTEKGPLELIETGADSEHTKDVRLFAGGHGLASTAADYLRFAQMFLNRGELDGVRILGRKTVDLMILNHLLPSMLPIAAPDPQPGMGFGLGFYVVMDLAQLRMMGSIGDHGWGGAADTHFWIDPQEQIVAIILQQYMPTRVNMTLVDYRTLVYQALEG